MASNLFDIKENLASLGLLILFSMWLIRRGLTPGKETPEQKAATRLYATLALSGGVMTWGMVLLGLWVTAEEGL